MNDHGIPGIWSPYERHPDDLDNDHTEQSDDQNAIPEPEMSSYGKTPGISNGALKAHIGDLISPDVRAKLEESLKR